MKVGGFVKNRRVFISSTIYDFADLRSALKFYLEENGYEVLASEYNDFVVNRDVDSYTACFDAIATCHFFILLIGNRIGGSFNDVISITRKEYQIAYDLAQQGKIKIIPFVRQNVWDHRARVIELAHLLKNDYKTDEEIEKIAYGKSHFAHQAKKIIEFIEEVSRIPEMKSSLTNGCGRPINNWIHVFSTFSDIVTCLRQELKLGNLEEKILKENLIQELYTNALSMNLYKTEKGHVVPGMPLGSLTKIKQMLKGLSNYDIVTRNFPMDVPTSWYLIFYAKPCGNIESRVLQQCIDSGMWYKIDNNGTTIESEQGKIARELLNSFKIVKQGLSDDSLEKCFRYYHDSKQENQCQMRGFDLLQCFYIALSRFVAYKCIGALLQYLLKGNSEITYQKILKDKECCEIVDKVTRQNFANESVSRADITQWVYGNN